jgi:K+-transporting ATPase A subunit
VASTPPGPHRDPAGTPPGPAGRLHAGTRATLDTTGPTFAVFLLSVIVIVGGLIYFPMLILGPIGERFVS